MATPGGLALDTPDLVAPLRLDVWAVAHASNRIANEPGSIQLREEAVAILVRRDASHLLSLADKPQRRGLHNFDLLGRRRGSQVSSTGHAMCYETAMLKWGWRALGTFAVAAVGGAAGAALVGVVASRAVNWNALAAVATFAAVLVALWPIWREERRRRGQAQALRLQLLTHLASLRPLFAAPSKREVGPSAPLTAIEGEPIDAIAALVPQAHLLEPGEYDLLARTFANLWLTKRAPNLIRPDILLALVDETITKLEQGEFHRGALPPPPWESPPCRDQEA